MFNNEFLRFVYIRIHCCFAGHGINWKKIGYSSPSILHWFKDWHDTVCLHKKITRSWQILFYGKIVWKMEKCPQNNGVNRKLPQYFSVMQIPLHVVLMILAFYISIWNLFGLMWTCLHNDIITFNIDYTLNNEFLRFVYIRIHCYPHTLALLLGFIRFAVNNTVIQLHYTKFLSPQLGRWLHSCI